MGSSVPVMNEPMNVRVMIYIVGNKSYVELVKWWGGLMPQTILVLIQNLKKIVFRLFKQSLAGHGTVRKFNFTFFIHDVLHLFK